MLTFAEYMSGAALIVSAASLCVSAHVAFRDRARLKLTSKFVPRSQYGPDRIVVAMMNLGRRPIILRLIGGESKSGRWSASFLDQDKGGIRLAEHERYEYTFEKDDTVSFHPEHEDIFFDTLWVEDSLGVRHPIPNASKYIDRLWSQ